MQNQHFRCQEWAPKAELLDRIVTSTNGYAKKKLPLSWYETITRAEILHFFAIYYHSGIVWLSLKEEYWKLDHSIWPIHSACQDLTHNHFKYIWRYIHLTETPKNEIENEVDTLEDNKKKVDLEPPEQVEKSGCIWQGIQGAQTMFSKISLNKLIEWLWEPSIEHLEWPIFSFLGNMCAIYVKHFYATHNTKNRLCNFMLDATLRIATCSFSPVCSFLSREVPLINNFFPLQWHLPLA